MPRELRAAVGAREEREGRAERGPDNLDFIVAADPAATRDDALDQVGQAVALAGERDGGVVGRRAAG